VVQKKLPELKPLPDPIGVYAGDKTPAYRPNALFRKL